VPLQGNWDFGLATERRRHALNIQPVIPFGISKSTNVILRVILPLTSQPGSTDARINGMGGHRHDVFFSP